MADAATTTPSRALRVPAPERHELETADGVRLLLTRYRGGDRGPVMVTHGLGVSSLIFSIDSIETNALEALVEAGFDVWLLDYRASIDLDASSGAFTGDEIALQDYPAAVSKVRELTGSDTIQVFAHCFGATTFVMAMLAGLRGVRSAVCSQIAAHVHAGPATRLKTGLRFPQILDTMGIHSLSARVAERPRGFDRVFGPMTHLWPLPEHARCKSEVCRRISFLYGPLYRHEQLNEETHERLHDLFGVACMKSLRHLGLMVRHKQVVDARGRDRYMPEMKRLAIPILFVHGALNDCYMPKSTQQTHDLLCEVNGEELYERQEIEGFGHIDCIFGKDASTHVYPHVVRHLEATA